MLGCLRTILSLFRLSVVCLFYLRSCVLRVRLPSFCATLPISCAVWFGCWSLCWFVHPVSKPLGQCIFCALWCRSLFFISSLYSLSLFLCISHFLGVHFHLFVSLFVSLSISCSIYIYITCGTQFSRVEYNRPAMVNQRPRFYMFW